MTTVFFDLDGTLIKGMSAEKRFFLFLLKRRVIGLRQLVAFSAFPLIWFTQFRMAVWKKNKAYLNGLRTRKIQSLSEYFVLHKLAYAIRPAVRHALKNHLDSGDTVILLTGTPDFIAYPVAKLLGIPHIGATVFSISNKHFTSRPPSTHPQGIEKAQTAKKICSQLNVHLANCAAYADSKDDIPLMTSVSEPIAVHPEKKLRKLAKKQGWQIIEN